MDGDTRPFHGTSLMDPERADIPGLTDDPVLGLIIAGKAKSLDEAEELYLDQSLPVILDLLQKKVSDEELTQHPLIALLRVRGSRGLEDSLL
jgi:hypothetical protein